jgi:hypothetical protein
MVLAGCQQQSVVNDDQESAMITNALSDVDADQGEQPLVIREDADLLANQATEEAERRAVAQLEAQQFSRDQQLREIDRKLDDIKAAQSTAAMQRAVRQSEDALNDLRKR